VGSSASETETGIETGLADSPRTIGSAGSMEASAGIAYAHRMFEIYDREEHERQGKKDDLENLADQPDFQEIKSSRESH
jgi:hypothetical protein